MTDNTSIAWTRTTFTSLWMGLALWVAAKAGYELDVESPTTIVVVGLTGGIVWRISELLANVPYLGYILFGVNKAPGYEQPTPPNPPEEAPPPDGFVAIWLLVALVVLVVAAIWLAGEIGATITVAIVVLVLCAIAAASQMR